MKKLFFGLALSMFIGASVVEATEKDKPNVILIMCDDLGWGDTGFNGSEIIKTPHLDSMAKDGSVLNHFYSVGPVCSPTRGSCLTGRHYYRFGVFYANQGRLPAEEYTIARMLKENGYTTGHFGKWHLGTLNENHSGKKGRDPKLNFAPPWERDYDESFVTEFAVRTWDPAKYSDYKNNPYYHNGKKIEADDNLDGDDSRVVMDRVIPFIEKAVMNKTPFLSVIWFHTPHQPLMAGQKYLDMYPNTGEAAHYYGAVTAMDEQVGRLREKLIELGQANNTIIFFCSDNGPEGSKELEISPDTKSTMAGTSGGFTGRKRSVHDGGCRVPALAYFPNGIKAGGFCDTPLSTLDYLPTIAAITGSEIKSTNILDGQDIMPILKGKTQVHEKSIPFRHNQGVTYACLVKGKFKLIIQSPTNESKDALYDLASDKKEKNNVISEHPELAKEMREEILAFLDSAKSSHAGEEYDSDYTPVNAWQGLGGKATVGTKEKGASKDKSSKKKQKD